MEIMQDNQNQKMIKTKEKILRLSKAASTDRSFAMMTEAQERLPEFKRPTTPMTANQSANSQSNTENLNNN